MTVAIVLIHLYFMQEELSATSTAEDSEPMETAEREVSRVAQSMQSLCLASTIIDEGDSENPFMCTEYVKDIYKYLKELEASNSCTYMYVHTHMSHAYVEKLCCILCIGMSTIYSPT